MIPFFHQGVYGAREPRQASPLRFDRRAAHQERAGLTRLPLRSCVASSQEKMGWKNGSQDGRASTAGYRRFRVRFTGGLHFGSGICFPSLRSFCRASLSCCSSFVSSRKGTSDKPLAGKLICCWGRYAHGAGLSECPDRDRRHRFRWGQGCHDPLEEKALRRCEGQRSRLGEGEQRCRHSAEPSTATGTVIAEKHTSVITCCTGRARGFSLVMILGIPIPMGTILAGSFRCGLRLI